MTLVELSNLHQPGTQSFTLGSKTGRWGFEQEINSGISITQRMKPKHLWGSGKNPTFTPSQISSILGGVVVGSVGNVGTVGFGTSLSQVFLFPGTQPSPSTKMWPTPHSLSTPPRNCRTKACKIILIPDLVRIKIYLTLNPLIAKIRIRMSELSNTESTKVVYRHFLSRTESHH